MATVIRAPSLSERVYTGTHGNESVAEGTFTVKSAAQDTEIHLLSLPVGVRINAVQLTSDAGLGSSVKITVKSGPHDVLGETDVASANTAKHIPVVPYTTQSDGELVVVTIKGAQATGTLNVLLRYTVVGY